jgi:spermidine synthase
VVSCRAATKVMPPEAVMIPWEFIGSAPLPAGGEALRLYQRGGEFSIRVGGGELMNSRAHESEDALADLACAKIAERPKPRVLIGGLGMGYTAAAALKRLGAAGRVVIAELAPGVVEWNRGPLAELAGRPLEDARVRVREIDVGRVLREGPQAYDAILLDVDNGPERLAHRANEWLYSMAGLAAAHVTLRPAGVLAIWSAAPDRAFSKRLRRAGFAVEEVCSHARAAGRGGRRTIWLAVRGA